MKDWEMTEELKPVPALPKDTGLISKAPPLADNILELLRILRPLLPPCFLILPH